MINRAPTASPNILGFAVALLKGRRLRQAAFAGAEFTDTEWFILLEVFVASARQHRLSLSDLYYVADVSKSSTIRAIDRLRLAGHLCREQDPGDARRKLVWLSSDTQARLTALLVETHRAIDADAESGGVAP